MIGKDLTNELSRYGQRTRKPDSTYSPTTSASDQNDKSLMRVSGQYFTCRGEKSSTASIHRIFPLINSSSESESVSCVNDEQSILEQNVTHDRSLPEMKLQEKHKTVL